MGAPPAPCSRRHRRAAAWVAVDTIVGSGLTASLETSEAAPVDYDGDGDQDVSVGYHDQGGPLFRDDGTGVYTAWR